MPGLLKEVEEWIFFFFPRGRLEGCPSFRSAQWKRPHLKVLQTWKWEAEGEPHGTGILLALFPGSDWRNACQL